MLNERLLLSAAQPYLAAGGNNHLLEIFESAHSVVLAVLAAPLSANMAAKHLPSYVDTLFTVSGSISIQIINSTMLTLYRFSRKTYPQGNSASHSKPFSR